MKIRVGFGYDVHQLKEGDDFWLGGIKIAHYKGAVGHSDADVLIHSICDALLGAANMRDIGFHFPPAVAFVARATTPQTPTMRSREVANINTWTLVFFHGANLKPQCRLFNVS